MDVRINQGYVITDSCHVGDSEFVLGVHSTAPQQFVTWKCKDQADYYWGHYFSTLFDAQRCTERFSSTGARGSSMPGGTTAKYQCV